MRTRTDEPDPELNSGQDAHVLVHALSYDDLLAAPMGVLPWDGRAEFSVGRGGDGLPVGLRSGVLRCADPWMSVRHAVFRCSAGAATVSDLGSRNGTYVDGHRIRERHPLSDGARIEIGRSLFVYRRVTAELAASLLEPDHSGTRLGSAPTYCPDLAFLVRQVARLADSKQAILVLAETGAGKELLAQEIHRASRRPGRLIAVDCGAIPDSLFESTLFGHTRGAFTGAEARTGEVQAADRGTIFLDELANLSSANQAKLLRVIETSRLTPLGAGEGTLVDVRWVGATNEDLAAQPDRFRADLYHRVAGFVARIPPLRRRREDLGVLVAHALREAQVPRASIQPAAARTLFAHPFPGNVRQLRSWVKTAALLAGDGPMRIDHFPNLVQELTVPQLAPTPPAGAAVESPLSKGRPNAEVIRTALATTKGNVVRAAKLLGTHPRQLYRWLDLLEVSLDDFRER